MDGGRKHARIVLLAGAGKCSSIEKLSAGAERCLRSYSDHGKCLQLSYRRILTIFKSTPGVWSHQDLDHILTRYGALVVERAGTDIEDSLATLSVSQSAHVEPLFSMIIDETKAMAREHLGRESTSHQRCI